MVNPWRTGALERKLGIDGLALRVCEVVRDVRGEGRAWIGIDFVHHELGDQSRTAIDAAVAFAAAKGWLAIGGAPAHSVLLVHRAPEAAGLSYVA